MTTAEKMRFFQENADARKATAIENNSFYGENLVKAQKIGEAKSLKPASPRRDLIDLGEMDYLGAKTPADSTAFDAGLGVTGAAKPGITLHPFYEKGEDSAIEYKGKRLDKEKKAREGRYNK